MIELKGRKYKKWKAFKLPNPKKKQEIKSYKPKEQEIKKKFK